MSHESPQEERLLQYLARAEEARQKAEEATDESLRHWWQSAAEAWLFLAQRIRPSR